jgi:aspartate carbamoyltransferase catalytic subunit
MKNFEGVKIIYAAPKGFQMKEDVCSFLERHKIPFRMETQAFENVLSEADAIYMTRIQDEHDEFVGESSKTDHSRFKLLPSYMPMLRPNAIIMHPFPRRDEIDVVIDRDPRAIYWRQERNGMWTRAALIAYIFNVHQEIMDY